MIATALAASLLLVSTPEAETTGQRESEQPNVETLLARHVEARGGAARWAALEAILLSGEQAENSHYRRFRRLLGRSGHHRLEVQDGESLAVTVSDGGAVVHRGADGSTAEFEPGPATDFRADAELGGPLLHPDAASWTVFAGPVETDSGPAWELVVRRPGTAEERWFLDTRTHLAIERISQRWAYGKARPWHTYFSDHRAVDGLVFPHLVEHEIDSTHRLIRIEWIVLDPPLDSASFALEPSTEH